jgi:hypothetical protein
MSDRVSELEAKVAELSVTIQQMEQRLGVLERGLTPAAARRVRAAAASAQSSATTSMLRQDAASVASTISLVGRTLLVMAGAFALRALTDKQVLPPWIGATLGFVYAGIWMAQADRAAAVRKLASAGFHGAAAVLIGFPLLIEAAARFHLFPSWIAAIVLSGFTAVGLTVAARRRFQTLAWLVVLAAIPAAFALAIALGQIAAPLVFLIVLGTGTVWLGYVLDWHGLRWPPAFAADLAVLFLAVEAVRSGARDGPVTAVLVQFALMAAYLGSTAVRTLRLGRSVVTFEIVQAAAVVVAGLGGAAFVAARVGTGADALGALALVAGAAGYAVALAFAESERSRANFQFYASLGAAFVLAGGAFLLPGLGRALFWAGLAVVAARGARRASRNTLAIHAALYAVAAAVASGLVGQAADGLLESPAVAWSAISPGELAVAAAIAFAAWTLATPARGALEHLPRVVLVVVLAASVAGLVLGVAVPAIAGLPGAGADAGVVATVRTAVLALGAVALALAGRSDGWAQARWLVWPVLGLAGLKMLVEDMPRSRPATLFLAFGLYGAALVLVPRLKRREAKPVAPAEAAAGGRTS